MMMAADVFGLTSAEERTQKGHVHQFACLFRALLIMTFSL